MIRRLDWFSPVAALLACVLSVVGLFGKVVERGVDSTTLYTVVGTALTMLLGFFSVYVSRAANRLAVVPRIFISYTRDEKARARQLREAFVKMGAKVWLDENELQPGSNLNASIGAAIEASDTVVAVLSPSLGQHAKAEIDTAIRKSKTIYTITTGPIPATAEIQRASRQIFQLSSDQPLGSVAGYIMSLATGRGTIGSDPTQRSGKAS